MSDFNSLLQAGAGQAWLYFPVALFLGAAHGLEPGHSKTMMAAFIVAVRGTWWQAVLLGLSAAISHSFVIWLLAVLALRFGGQWGVEATEPWFLMATGVIVAGMAVWTLWRIHERTHHRHCHHAHGHGEQAEAGKEDAHAQGHAAEIKRRFGGREATTGQIVLFGLTGGLMPCPAALTVLLACLQLREFTLGFSLVVAFSTGLALTLVAVGVAAALGMRQVEKRSGVLSRLAERAPYLSSFVLMILGVAFFVRGAWGLL
ncbi:MAG: sulfite exporter TauE/SafE family protein [Puniceicoccales bacterium]|jgi:nickel/cobalt exporter|nr:sulfite exporter TauE/SafE family protein [Puniceicoccales bacterium]